MAKSSRISTAGRASSPSRLCQVLVGVAAGEVGQGAAGLEEPDVGAVADGEVAEGLGDVALPDADRAVQDHRLAGVRASAGRPGRGSGRRAASGMAVKSKPFQGGLFLEPGPAEPAGAWTWPARRVISSSHRTWRNSRWPSSPARAWARRASMVSEHPGQLQGAQCLSRALVSIVVVMVGPSSGGVGRCR